MSTKDVRKKPVKRLFSGMVGREVPATEVKSSDEKVRYVPTSKQRFQSEQHDSNSFRAKAPVGTVHIPGAAGSISRVVQDVTGVSTFAEGANSGMSTFDTGDTSRSDTPDWIRDPKLINEYFDRRVEKSEFIITREIDRFILTDYFLSNHTDEIIFQDYEASFNKERRVLGRRSRWTSSPDAVKHRRERLLRDRERFYEPPKAWTLSSWRGILASTASGEWAASQLHGIATTKRKRKASKIADYYGLVGRFQEPAEIIADSVFDDRTALDLWMTDHGILPEDVIRDETKWR